MTAPAGNDQQQQHERVDQGLDPTVERHAVNTPEELGEAVVEIVKHFVAEAVRPYAERERRNLEALSDLEDRVATLRGLIESRDEELERRALEVKLLRERLRPPEGGAPPSTAVDGEPAPSLLDLPG